MNKADDVISIDIPYPHLIPEKHIDGFLSRIILGALLFI